MPKRHHNEDIEDDDVYQKRARREGSSEEDEEPTRTRVKPEPNGKGKGKGKGKARNISEDEDEQSQDEEELLRRHLGTQDMTEEEFEMAFAAKIQAQIKNKRVGSGVSRYSLPELAAYLIFVQSIGDLGIIEYIEMHQFMCHKYLKFNFGPQINFIIGLTGS